MSKIYLASSWRNTGHREAVRLLREYGHEVYNFRAPMESWRETDPGQEGGFQWTEVDQQWMSWTPWSYLQALTSGIAEAGFENDFIAMTRSDTCVLLLPSGRSAHIEAGWFAGRPNKRLFIVLPGDLPPRRGDELRPAWEPELMYKMADGIFLSVEDLAESGEL